MGEFPEPLPEEIGLAPEGEVKNETEPTAAEFIVALEDWREQLDGETFDSLVEEFNNDVEGGLGYLYSVAAENGLNPDELLAKYNLVRDS